LAEIERLSGSHFEPRLVEKFLEIVGQPARESTGFPAELLLDTVTADAVDSGGHS
jgi:HD-GYP domain-containing protein (c-di-GMP phosphodiesterase class II)